MTTRAGVSLTIGSSFSYRCGWEPKYAACARRPDAGPAGATAGSPLRDSHDAAIDASFAIYLKLYQAAWRAFEDARPALDALQDAGLTVAVLTNGADEQQRAKLATIGLGERAGPLFSSDAIGFAKPDPRAYHHVCEQLMTVPSRVVHVGDRYDLDVLAARTAGLHAIHLDRTNAGPQDETAQIQNLRDLPDLLRDNLASG